MKQARTTLTWSVPFSLALFFAACLIIEVEQPDTARQGDVITVNVSIVDSTADQNAWKGVLGVLVPADWEFVAGEYSGDLGAGTVLGDDGWADSLEAISPAPDGMKWLGMVSDNAYAYPTPPIHVDAALQLKVGQTTGTFDIGYFTTKTAFTVKDLRDDPTLFAAAADTSMNHRITVTSATAIEDVLQDGVPTTFLLEQNYPNPFNPSTTVRYALQAPTEVRLAVYDLAGREVALLDQGYRGAGVYEVDFDAAELPSGLYLYRLNAGPYEQTRTMVLAK